MDINPEIESLFARWLDRTVELHHEELKKLGVEGTGELDSSVRGTYRRLGEGYLEGSLYFDEHGRFVDMGSGRGYSHGQRLKDSFDTETRRGEKGRKRKPWYGRVWYSRINDLQGAVGFKLMEEVVRMGHEVVGSR